MTWNKSNLIVVLNAAVQPSLRAVKLGAKQPVINGSFVAPTASVIGSVNIGSNSSIWYSAVVRGDNYLLHVVLLLSHVILFDKINQFHIFDSR